MIQGDIYSFSSSGVLGQKARGIDVSKFQGTIDWNAVAADGITFAIIRCGYRGYGSGALVEDATFRRNIQGATAAGIQVGVYFYSQAIDEAEAVEEASMVLSLVQGYSLPYGVYFDTEKVAGDTGRADGISAAQRTANAVAFCETIRNAGYTPGVYSYASWFYQFAQLCQYQQVPHLDRPVPRYAGFCLQLQHLAVFQPGQRQRHQGQCRYEPRLKLNDKKRIGPLPALRGGGPMRFAVSVLLPGGAQQPPVCLCTAPPRICPLPWMIYL